MDISEICCRKCAFWGDGSGTGTPYDAGHVNECKHKLITGPQYASSASLRNDEISKVIIDDGGQDHHVVTRWNFGCVLFKTSLDVLKKGK